MITRLLAAWWSWSDQATYSQDAAHARYYRVPFTNHFLRLDVRRRTA